MDVGNKYNLALTAGESFNTQLVWKLVDGTPVDLTGYNIKAEMRVASTDVTASAQFSAVAAIPASSGTISLSLTPSQSVQLSAPCYLYDLRVTSGSTFSKTLLTGKVTVKYRVTH